MIKQKGKSRCGRKEEKKSEQKGTAESETWRPSSGGRKESFICEAMWGGKGTGIDHELLEGKWKGDARR